MIASKPSASASIDPAQVVWSLDPRELGDRPLVVCLHGYGSDARDLMNVVPQLPPELAYASLLAPEPCPGTPGRQWFPLHFTPSGDLADATSTAFLGELAANADAAGRAVLAWLDGLEPAPRTVLLLGFSQGGIVALAALRRAPERFAGTAIVASLAAPPADPAADEALRRARPRVWWGRGDADPVIPARAVAYTEAWMSEHADATVVVEPGLGHDFSLAERLGVAAFLRERARAV